MGMFDTVAFEMPCPNCGNIVKDFQSKDGSCILAVISVSEVCNFYSSCSKCKTRIEFFRKVNDKTMPRLKEVLEDFDMHLNL